MYLNTTQEIRAEMWSCLLEIYHSNIYSTLTMILKSSSIAVPEMDEILKVFTREKFLKHFKRLDLKRGVIDFLNCLLTMPMV